MSTDQTSDSKAERSIRLWPGVVLAALLTIVRFGIPIVSPDNILIALIGGMGAALLILLWWIFFSRAQWSDRIGAIVLMGLALLLTYQLSDVSIRTGGMGRLLIILAVPTMTLGLAVGALSSRRLSPSLRKTFIAAGIVLSAAAWTLIRTGGITGDGQSDFHWRWSKSPEQMLLAQAQANDEPAPTTQVADTGNQASDKPEGVGKAAADLTEGKDGENAGAQSPDQPPTLMSPATEKRPEWPGFRGRNRDGIVRGVKIETDWSQSPPVLLWKHPIGPGWSSFAVRGDVCYTQEQRGQDELVSCYKLDTGAPVWRHRDSVRFYESNGGAGPRATPTLSGGRLYTFGATGILNALNVDTGAVAWSRNVASESETKVPGWGFTSSPLVVGNLVIVAAAGRLVAYERATGKLRWLGPVHGVSYSSPQWATIDGVPQIILLSASGATSVVPSTGHVLWEHSWEGGAIVQPAVIGSANVLINSIDMTGGLGTRRLALKHEADNWSVEERWTSNGLKPYFNDFVIHKGYAFGFDGNILSCINLEDGKRVWKGGRYGNGQMVLLSDQDLLLVLSEEGELALVSATPDGYKEFAKSPAIEGKTWNHPVLVGDILLVRNGQEMAAFRLPLAAH